MLSRNVYIWDVSLVLDKLRNFFPLHSLRLKDLTLKTEMLMNLLTGQRGQSIHLLKLRDVQIHNNRGRLLLRTPGPVPFGTCICSNVETILSLTCHIYGPFEFRTSLGTSILLVNISFSSIWKAFSEYDYCRIPCGL